MSRIFLTIALILYGSKPKNPPVREVDTTLLLTVTAATGDCFNTASI